MGRGRSELSRDLVREISLLRRELRKVARPEKHPNLQSYLGSPVPVLGVYAPDLRRGVRGLRARHRTLSAETVRALANALWRGPTFEDRIAACELLEAYPRITDAATWGLVDRWLDTAQGWGLCDSVAGGPASRLLVAEPSRFADVERWSRSPDPWRRRASLYSLNRWVRAGRLAEAFRLLRSLRRDPDPWVDRAVGTWLRECWKQDRARTERFLVRYARELPPVVRSVATERAPADLRLRLRELAKAGAPEG
jgi:3-methyladenine DNA glycosylase AlkD